MRERPDVLDWLAAREEVRVAYRPARPTHTLGYGAASVYVETFWLPLVGPTALLALRRLDAWLANAPGEITISVRVLGESLGIGAGTGRRSAVVRTLTRLVNFRLASIDSETYMIHRELPMLSPRQLGRLPACLITAHQQLIQGSTCGIDPASMARQSNVQ